MQKKVSTNFSKVKRHSLVSKPWMTLTRDVDFLTQLNEFVQFVQNLDFKIRRDQEKISYERRVHDFL